MAKTSNKIKHESEALTGDAGKNKSFRCETTFDSEFRAKLAYQHAVGRLLDVNRWSDVSVLTADFVLYQADGQPKPVMYPQPGDYILIRLPGPVPENWVHIFQFSQSADKTEFSAHPCRSPLTGDSPRTDHFFVHSTISTFCVERTGNKLIASQTGLNERINNHEPEAGDRRVINTVIAETGWLFYQALQWESLCSYWINE